MALESRLELRLSQKLILTPQLQQAIKLLQMPYLELSQFLSQELIENPFLEETADEVSADELTQEEKDSVEVEEPFDDAGAPLEKLMNFSVDEYFEDRISDGETWGISIPGRSPPHHLRNFFHENLICTTTFYATETLACVRKYQESRGNYHREY